MTTNELDAFLGRPPIVSKHSAHRLGVVVGGSLGKGLDVKLDGDGPSVEDLAVGRYVVVHGADGRRFFGLVTDIFLDNSDAWVTKAPPTHDDDFMRAVLSGTTAFGRLHVSLMLVLEPGSQEPQPVKTVPAHFSSVYEASEKDVSDVFSPTREEPGAQRFFYIGEPLDMSNVKVYLNLDRFVERSSGVFGKSGTGKTFLVRMLLAGIVRQNVAVNLIFDMHNEYGWSTHSEGHHEVKGLSQLFSNGQVSVVTLDRESSDRRNSKVDFDIEIGYNQIIPEDLDTLAQVLDLSEVQIGVLYEVHRRLGPHWITELLKYEYREEEEEDEWDAPVDLFTDPDAPAKDGKDAPARPQARKRHPLAQLIKNKQLQIGTLGAIQRKLGIFRRFGFLKETVRTDSVKQVLDYLDSNRSIVMEFGRYGDAMEAYILVANFFTRRLHELYKAKKERALGRRESEPRPLVITIEEAHKFLTPEVARHTIFGTIARELRKYNVTLLIVDQRPSGIDEEVISQIGTRVTCLLDNEADVRAVFSGVAGAQALREVLARLDTKQQALILGHAVPMPVVVKTRAYDQEFYAAMGHAEGEALRTRSAQGLRQLRGAENDDLV